MDIAVIREALGNFETFINNVAGLFQNLPEFIKDLAEFFTGGAETGLEETKGFLGSSEPAPSEPVPSEPAA